MSEEEESFVILGSSPIPSITSPLPSVNISNVSKEAETSIEVAQDITNMLKSAIFVNSEQTESGIASPKDSIKNGIAGPTESLAASFLLGEINSDVLKTSVYSQFPSFCSKDECAEDVAKLQTFMTEYVQLKSTMLKVNATMQQFYSQTKQWKEEMEERHIQHRLLLQKCNDRIEALCAENEKFKRNLDDKMDDAFSKEETRRKEQTELIQCVSEKSHLIQNMSEKIEKLEQQQLASLDTKKGIEKEADYVSLSEHQEIIKGIERKLSELLAKNLDLNDVQKQYIDEINCLKVNLVAGEELLRQSRFDIELLQTKDEENKKIMSKFVVEKGEMEEKIALLCQQIDVYRKDFEIERIARQNLAGEKDQLLSDLRALQRKNHDLIVEEQERLKGKSFIKVFNSIINNQDSKTEEMHTVSQSAQCSLASQSTQTIAPPQVMKNCCPICNSKFESLNVLQKHVNECLDKN